MPAAGGAEFEYSLADPEFGEKAHQELSSECSFEYHLPLSQLYCRKLSFYPEGTWLCRLGLDPQIISRRGRRRQLTVRTNFYFIFRPSDQNMPVMPLGNDTVWVLRANKHYGLDLRGRNIGEDDPAIVVVVTVNGTQGLAGYGGPTSAPAFREVAAAAQERQLVHVIRAEDMRPVEIHRTAIGAPE